MLRTITETIVLLESGKISSQELVEEYLKTIEERDGDIHAYLEVFSDVRKEAKLADEKRSRGEKGKLLGIPLAVKDNILIEGRRAGAASKILEGYVAAYDATAIAKLKKEGAIFIGRTNMDEFAMGGSTENSAYGVTKNPHDLTRVPGGSSGGSAAAVAMGGALAALGSDTGGSVRQPASFCGVVGLKPTYGAISRSGLMAMGSSLDQIGPLTNSVADAELLFEIMKGYDPLDSTSLPDKSSAPLSSKLTIGVPRSFVSKGLDEAVAKNFENSLERLKTLGYNVVDIELPNINHALSVYYVLMPAEVSANLSRFDGVRYGLREEGKNLLEEYTKSRGAGFGKEVKRRILLGTYVLSHGYYDAYYNKANAVRTLLRKDFAEAFSKVDIIATPTAPTPAFRVGEKNTDPLSMYLQDLFSVPANLVGVPAISIPSGTTSAEGTELPLSLQLIAPHQEEARLFAVGKAFRGETN